MGWYEVFHSLLKNQSEQARSAINAWYPADSGIVEKIEELHTMFPQGFCRLQTEGNRAQFLSVMEDVEGCEKADLATEVAKKSKWSRVKQKLVTGVGGIINNAHRRRQNRKTTT